MAKTPAQLALRAQTVDRKTAEAMVFGAKLARSLVYTERPEDLIYLTAKAIWDNFETYFAIGEWPVPVEIEADADTPVRDVDLPDVSV